MIICKITCQEIEFSCCYDVGYQWKIEGRRKKGVEHFASVLMSRCHEICCLSQFYDVVTVTDTNELEFIIIIIIIIIINVIIIKYTSRGYN